MFELRSYQIEIAQKACEKLKALGLVYLTMQPRTGKSHTSMECARLYGAKNVLFLTKKIAINDIGKDYKEGGYPFEITIINNESLHKVECNFDLIISDEHHRLSAPIKPNKNAKDFKKRFFKHPIIMLSGTPAAETDSQWYHSFWVSNKSPFREFPTFYKWADVYVNKYQVNLGYGLITKYDRAKSDQILPVVNQYLLTQTQQQSGFQTLVNEQIIYCPMRTITYNLIDKLKKDFVLIGNQEQVIADSAVKMQSKLLQFFGGTIKFESGNRKVIDPSKAEFVKNHFAGKKIAIFYYFIAEFQMLKDVFGDTLTDNLQEFNTTDKHIALQQVRGAEGISLKAADVLVFINFGFSCVKYQQSIDRLTTMDRKTNDVYFIMAQDGIEEKVYKTLQKKRDYSAKIFLKDYGIKFPKQENQTVEG